MSALRLNYPGQPVRLVELGPARARLTPSAASFSDRFTMLHEALRPTDGRFYRWKSEPRPKRVVSTQWERCLRVMRTGEACGRRKGHSVGACRSAASVERGNAQRRSES